MQQAYILIHGTLYPAATIAIAFHENRESNLSKVVVRCFATDVYLLAWEYRGVRGDLEEHLWNWLHRDAFDVKTTRDLGFFLQHLGFASPLKRSEHEEE